VDLDLPTYASARVENGAKEVMGFVNGSKNQGTKVKIVWRNPHPVRAHRRRKNVERAGAPAMYLLQEFVDDGYLGYWATISDLEVLVGGRVA